MKQGSGDSLSWDYFWDGPPQRTYNLEKNTRINVVGDKIRRGRPYENANVPDGYYTDGMITDSAIEWLDRFDSDRPFFLAVGLMKPHLPFNAPECTRSPVITIAVLILHLRDLPNLHSLTRES